MFTASSIHELNSVSCQPSKLFGELFKLPHHYPIHVTMPHTYSAWQSFWLLLGELMTNVCTCTCTVYVCVCTYTVLVGRRYHNGLHNSSHVYMYAHVHVCTCTCTYLFISNMHMHCTLHMAHVCQSYFSGLEPISGCLFVKVILMNLWHHFLSTQIRIKCVIEEY